MTLYPSASKCSMTALQLEPLAQAPCSRTMLGSAVMIGLLPGLRSIMTTPLTPGATAAIPYPPYAAPTTRTRHTGDGDAPVERRWA